MDASMDLATPWSRSPVRAILSEGTVCRRVDWYRKNAFTLIGVNWRLMFKAVSNPEVATRRKIGHIALIISVLVIAFSFRVHPCTFSPHNISNASQYLKCQLWLEYYQDPNSTQYVNHNEQYKKININMLPWAQLDRWEICSTIQIFCQASAPTIRLFKPALDPWGAYCKSGSSTE